MITDVKMHRRFPVAMQIHDVVRINRKFCKGQTQILKIGQRTDVLAVFLDQTAQFSPDQRDVFVAILAQFSVNGVNQCWTQVGVVAVKVLTAAHLKTAKRFHIDILGKANRVGKRHNDDITGDLALCVGFLQKNFKVVERNDTGQFIGMQSSLEIGLWALAGLAITADCQGA